MKDPHGTTVHFSCKSGQKAIPSGVPNRQSHHNNPRSSLTLYALPESAIQHNRRKDGIAVYKVNKVRFDLWRLSVVACDVVAAFLFGRHALVFLSCLVLYSHHFTYCFAILFLISFSTFVSSFTCFFYYCPAFPFVLWPMISRQFTHLTPSHFCLCGCRYFMCHPLPTHIQFLHLHDNTT